MTQNLNDPIFKTPKLTALEKFVFANENVSSASLAAQTNRTEGAIAAAYSRALKKTNEIAAIKARTQFTKFSA